VTCRFLKDRLTIDGYCRYVFHDRCTKSLLVLSVSALVLAGCGDHTAPTAATLTAPPIPSLGQAGATATPKATATPSPTVKPTAGKAAKRTSVAKAVLLKAGNPSGHAGVPAAARAAGISHPDHVIGHGSPAGCTSAAVLSAVAAGGVTTFNCGPAAITITLTKTAKVFNAHPDVVLDGGGKVTLSGGGKRRILYQNTCDKAQGLIASNCTTQQHPRLTVQNLTFADGNATGQTTDGGGGGAIFARGGRLKVVNSRFIRNTCDRTGPDLGGAAIRVIDQFGGSPVYIVSSTFGGAAGKGGICSNGGALSSIGISWVVLNSLFSYNSAVGRGANPAEPGTPGGGSGGAIYTDGNTYTLTLSGTRIENNHAKEGGGAVFYVSNDQTGSLKITGSTLRSNPSDGFETQGYPGIFYRGSGGHPTVSGSTLR
jgi:hypothetical protein